jgi:hypothetical protein
MTSMAEYSEDALIEQPAIALLAACKRVCGWGTLNCSRRRT